MPDVILLNEPIPQAREFIVQLATAGGATVSLTGGAGGVVSGATIKIGSPGNNLVADAACTLTELTGGSIPGPWRLRLSPAAVAAAGEYAYEIEDSLIAPGRGGYTVARLDILYYGAVASVPSATAIALDPSNPGGNASGTDKFYADNTTGRMCLATIVYGTGAVQSRKGTYYIGSTHTLELDNPWVVAPDATSIVRITPIQLRVGD